MAEPVTTLTDFLLAFLGWFLAWKLRQSGLNIECSRRLWAWGLGVQGTGALAGAIYHGFAPHLNSSTILWSITLVLLSAAVTLFLAGLGVAALSPKAARIFLILLVVKFVAYTIWVWPRRDFLPALCDQAFAFVLLVGLLIIGRFHDRSALPYLALGQCTIVAGGIIQYFHIGLHQHFNHNDLYHVLGGLTLWFFYRAGGRLSDPAK